MELDEIMCNYDSGGDSDGVIRKRGTFTANARLFGGLTSGVPTSRNSKLSGSKDSRPFQRKPGEREFRQLLVDRVPLPLASPRDFYSAFVDLSGNSFLGSIGDLFPIYLTDVQKLEDAGVSLDISDHYDLLELAFVKSRGGRITATREKINATRKLMRSWAKRN